MGVRQLRPRLRPGGGGGAAAGCRAPAHARLPDAGPALPQVQAGKSLRTRSQPKAGYTSACLALLATRNRHRTCAAPRSRQASSLRSFCAMWRGLDEGWLLLSQQLPSQVHDMHRLPCKAVACSCAPATCAS